MLALRKKHFGFTLIELVLVIIVVAILGTIATVAFQGESINVVAQAELLASDIRYVQFLSMTLSTPYRINFQSDRYSFSDATGLQPILHLSYGSNVVVLRHGAGLSWSGLPNNYLVFNRHGVPYIANADPLTAKLTENATITVEGPDHSVQLTVSPETGNVRG